MIVRPRPNWATGVDFNSSGFDLISTSHCSKNICWRKNTLQWNFLISHQISWRKSQDLTFSSICLFVFCTLDGSPSIHTNRNIKSKQNKSLNNNNSSSKRTRLDSHLKFSSVSFKRQHWEIMNEMNFEFYIRLCQFLSFADSKMFQNWIFH